MIVSNSTILIYLGKLNKLHLLKKFFKKVLIPKAVFEEVVVVGKKGNHADAILAEKAINEGWILVKECSELTQLKDFGIDKGEAQAISLALKLNTGILLDQTHARIAAKAVGLNPKGTLFVLLKALKKNLISFEEFIDLLEQLIQTGFRLDQEVYLEAIKKAGEIKKIRKV
ncbi:DUF3368 domain-containing protein [Candidatus Micrarchaeota archaeon]|nr:DUF3368 domain-containing protein [Candidatus Micrarchaeota archaeon]